MDNKVREEVIDWILQPKNKELLKTLKQIKNASSNDWFDDLTEEENQWVSRGQKDHQKGNTLTSKAFWKSMANSRKVIWSMESFKKSPVHKRISIGKLE